MKKIEDLEKAVEEGSILAISRLTGITRQTLYRWKRQGKNIDQERARHLKEKRGPGRPITFSPDLPGINQKKIQTAARKALAVATRDFIGAMFDWFKESPKGRPPTALDDLDTMMPIFFSTLPENVLRDWIEQAKRYRNPLRTKNRVYADMDHPFDRPQGPWIL